MKALFTPHLLHFSQLCPHFPPWFNSNGITCSEMFGKAPHSLPGVSLSHSSSLWQLSDMHCRGHRYKAYIHLARTVGEKRLEAAQNPAATTCCAITLHGNERDSPSPNGARGQWSREANANLSSSSNTKDDLGAFPSPAQLSLEALQCLRPRQHPPAPMAPGFISPVMSVMGSLTVVPRTAVAGAAWGLHKSHRLVTPDLDGSV